MGMAASLVVELLALFFWLRGLYRNCKADVVAGWALLLITMWLCLAPAGHPSGLSVPLGIFAAVSLAVSFDSNLKASIISADRLRLMGVALLFLAFVFSIML